MKPQPASIHKFDPLAAGLCWLILSACAFAQTAQDQETSDRRPRPTPNAELRVETLSPELEQILKNWEQASGRIRTLQGHHYRWIYDHVFNVEKRAHGVFYYESPDKGRIDLNGRQPRENEVSEKKDPKTGEPFQIQADHGEKWICDGQAVLQINDEQKTAEKYLIPPEQQGRNIIDGPLPFLFGLPAEKAKKRYHFQLLQNTPTDVWLLVTPRWAQDAANYRQATVILNKQTYLPTAVQLIDPPGTKQTVFRFDQLQVNRKENLLEKLFPGGDPFHPSLRGYQQTVVNRASVADGEQRASNNAKEPSVPSVIGFSWQTAENLLKQLGYTVRYERGAPATRDELIYIVYQQTPSPTTVLPKGQVVTLTLYDKSAGSSAPTKR